MAIPTCIIGVDPGKGGGIAVCHAGCESCAFKMPDTDADLFHLLEGVVEVSDAIVFMEKVGASPQMGVVSAFKFGQSFGAIRMACVAAGLRLEMVSPQKWQRALGLIVKGRVLGQNDMAKKNHNKARAQELFPHIQVTHAIADALLIAEYGWRQYRIRERLDESAVPPVTRA